MTTTEGQLRLERLRDALRTLVGRELDSVHFGWLTLGAALALSLIGVYAIDLASYAEPARGPIRLSGLPLKQLVFLGVGLAASLAIAAPHYRHLRRVAWPALIVSIALLIFLLIPAVPTWLVRPRNGARAWIDLGPVDFQPSELAKIAYVLVMASYFRWRDDHRTLKGLIVPGVLTAIPVGLIILQPDLGTASLFVPALFAMLVSAGARLRHLVLIVLLAAMAGPAAYPLLRPHQKERIVGLIKMVQDPGSGADDVNYQSIVAQRLAGAGGLTGLDEKTSRAVIRYNPLPHRHNDMVFSVIVNRFGMLGGAAVLGLYALWMGGAIGVAARCREPFGRLIVVGFVAFIGAQVIINVGMNLGRLPIVGLTLPFVSYGGSSMLTVWLMTGLIFNIGVHRASRLTPASFEFHDDEA